MIHQTSVMSSQDWKTRLALSHLHININHFSFDIASRPDVKSPQYPRYIDGYGSRSKVQARANTAAPAECAVPQVTGILALSEETLRLKLVRVWEVCII